MTDEIKRLRYFQGFFLQDYDFTAEQDYHRRIRYLHNRWLHNWGIVFGLNVNQGPGAKQVTVSKGMALVLITEDGEELSKEVVLTADASPIDVPGGGGEKSYVVLTADHVVEDQPQTVEPEENTRYIERAIVSALSPGSPKPNNEDTLILAKVILNATGDGIESIDPSERRNAGIAGGDLEARSLRFSIQGVNPNQWPQLRGKSGPARLEVEAGRSDFTGDINLTNGEITLASGKKVDGRDVSSDGQALDDHLAANVHVTSGDNHNHAAGDGAPIPWSAITDIPAAIKGFCSFIGFNGVVLRQYGIESVDRHGVGDYTVTWTEEINNAIVSIALHSTDRLFLRMVSASVVSYHFRVEQADGNLQDASTIQVVIL